MYSGITCLSVKYWIMWWKEQKGERPSNNINEEDDFVLGLVGELPTYLKIEEEKDKTATYRWLRCKTS